MPRWTTHRARVAGLKRRRPPDDPEVVDAVRDLKAARIADDICRVVKEIPHDQATLDRVAVMLAEAPPVTTSQRETAARLLARRAPVSIKEAG